MTNGSGFLIKHWHVVVYIAGLIFLGGMTLADNETQSDRIMQNVQKIERNQRSVQDIEQRLARIEQKQINYGEDIKEIKADVKSILREVKN